MRLINRECDKNMNCVKTANTIGEIQTLTENLILVSLFKIVCEDFPKSTLKVPYELNNNAIASQTKIPPRPSLNRD